ncbi:MAG: hypothetical protein J0L67_04155 [Cytophagales bacterium]|nr:hypothetical protein [Cytophagales bacterium]
MRTLTLVFITALTIFASCGNEENEPQPTSRTLRYELTGNFSGSNMIAAYTTASGVTVTEQITSLPWNKEITFDTNVTGANLVISGAGGIVGQQATLVIRKGGSQVGTPITATVDAGGAFTLSSPVILF